MQGSRYHLIILPLKPFFRQILTVLPLAFAVPGLQAQTFRFDFGNGAVEKGYTAVGMKWIGKPGPEN
jgi:hypothetical protein